MTGELRICALCGAKFSAIEDREFCPVCMLGRDLAGELACAKPPSSEVSERYPKHAAQRFEHYELALNEDGHPLELGRGAMGITYKAFDLNLRCFVTLKLISDRYLGSEPTRLRFLREARAAASVRHPNVASVFYLGRREHDYFYAMEFVEGETLQSFIKRSRTLEIRLALKIAEQIAAGLSAIHKQKLVHRDIKPSNIMVSFEDTGAVAAKIIDLGLAKPVNESASQGTISTAGAFAGTPEYASPEQFAGFVVDIRSDLYSLGVVLWEMVTGRAPFRGVPAELMYQHQHAPLPFAELEALPEPVTALIEVLLEKDPKRRLQTPAQLLQLMPTITNALEEGQTFTYQSLRQTAVALPFSRSRSRGPEKISIARLPVTGSEIFGREQDIAFLDGAWANEDINVVTIVAWAGVGKSTLVNHWLRAMAARQYRSAELVFAWSFYRQGTSRGTSSADEFVDTTLAWFGDPDPRIGTPWEKGERLANLIARRRTLLVLDGLEPLQNPPGSQEGRIRDSSLQALLRELAAFNRGLCVITTRLPVADIVDHERVSAPRLDLEHLSRDAGALLLRALGVNGDEIELRVASDEFNGHCLALTLLGSYLTDAYNGDVRRRKEVAEHLTHDVRQGSHARKVMASYQAWFEEGPELSILRILGLFDRPADENALRALLTAPAISGLTESLPNFGTTEWRTILARLRRARLLAEEDRHDPGSLDAHPLVREYFGVQLREQFTEAWREGNKRLYHHYAALAPELPESISEMEPLFLAVICGCNAGLFREALHEVYIPRIQRRDAAFASDVLGARGALLTALVHFFEHASWEAPVETGVGDHSLTPDDQLFIVMQAALHLSVTGGGQTSDVRICNERAESLARSLNRPRLLDIALAGHWRYCLINGKLGAAIQIADRLYSLARQHNDASTSVRAYSALGVTHYYLGDFELARDYTIHGVQIWRSGDVKTQIEDVDAPIIGCLCHQALSEWHFGEIASCHSAMEEAISVARRLNNAHGLGVALLFAAGLGYMEHNRAVVERLASELFELATRHSIMHFRALGTALLGWARTGSVRTAEGISCIDRGIHVVGGLFNMTPLLTLKAEALYLADRTSDALETIKEELLEVAEARWWCAEMHRLRGIFLAALGAEDSEVEGAFREAIRIAQQQKSVSLTKRAEATFTEYYRQKARGLEGQRLRLSIG
jgi:serine/threonine protein kinase